MKKNFRFMISLAVGSLLIGALTVGTVWWSTETAKNGELEWLFSQTADGGSFTPNDDGSYTLTLTGVDPYVTAFTDRPVRDSKILALSEFIGAWPGAFASSAPNAVLVEHNSSGASNSTVVTLNAPMLVEDVLTFRATVVSEKPSQTLANIAGNLHPTPPSSFATSSLFIDSQCSGSRCTASALIQPWPPGLITD
jgi:hypothetical protein